MDRDTETRLKQEQECLRRLRELREKRQQIEDMKRELNNLESLVREEAPSKLCSEGSKRLQRKMDRLEKMQDKESIVKLNVGSRIFVTTKETLMREETIFKVMLFTSLPLDQDEQGALKIDRNPEHFPIILDHLRTGQLKTIGIRDDDETQLMELLEESDFYGTTRLSHYLLKLLEQIEEKRPPVQNSLEEPLADHHATEQQQGVPKDLTSLDELRKLTSGQCEQYLSQQKEKLAEQQKMLEEHKNKLISSSQNQESPKLFLEVNVGGTTFKIDAGIIARNKECIFYHAMLKWKSEVLFVNRDPELFQHIFDFLKTSRVQALPHNDRATMRQIHEEAKFYNITSLLDFFDPTRYPIESIGEENIQMKQDEDHLRSLFASDRKNPILSDPYLCLLPVFSERDTFSPQYPPDSIPLLFDFENPSLRNQLSQNWMEAHYGWSRMGDWKRDRIMNVLRSKNKAIRYERPPKPQLCPDRQSFLNQWDVFTSGLFVGVDWRNMFCAGGAVLAAAMRVDEQSDAFFGQRGTEEDALDILGIDYTEDDQILFDKEEEGEEEEEEMLPEDVFSEDEDIEDKNQSGPVNETSQEMRKHITELIECHHEKRRRRAAKKQRLPTQKLFNYYASSPFNASDIDIFLYALDEKEAEEKVRDLYKTFQRNLRPEHQVKYRTDEVSVNNERANDIFVLRTKAAITFYFRYPIRSIQVILRIYKSPAEILMGFDIDSCCIGYDGQQVWCLPRCRRAINTAMNLVDVDRQSTTYEIRLFKYAKRGFRVGVPGYDPSLVKNHEIFGSYAYYELEAAVARAEGNTRFMTDHFGQYRERRKHFKESHGLSRLLLLENSLIQSPIYAFSSIGLEGSRAPNYLQRIEIEIEDLDPQEVRHLAQERGSQVRDATQHSDYENVFIPFTNGWDPRKIYRRLNSIVSFVREGLGRHEFKKDITFALNNVDEIFEKKITWLTINPGTQAIGSFHPISTNFYRDAYTHNDEEKRVIAKALEILKEGTEFVTKKCTKVKWSYDIGEGYRPYEMAKNVALERAYRRWKKESHLAGICQIEDWIVIFAEMKMFNVGNLNCVGKVQRDFERIEIRVKANKE